jgi:hypothetical protein
MTLLKKSKTSLSAILAIALITLSIVGFSYAHWSAYLYINGEVSTGELDWGFIGWDCMDHGVDYHSRDGFAGPAPLFWQDPERKDIGWQEIIPVDTDQDGDIDTLYFNLYDVYPSYFTSMSVYAVNTGTIPLRIDSVIINDVIIYRSTPTPYIQLDLDGDGINDIDFWYGNSLGIQLHPGQQSDEISFWIHILQGAKPDTTLSFSIKLLAVAWNEYVPP